MVIRNAGCSVVPFRLGLWKWSIDSVSHPDLQNDNNKGQNQFVCMGEIVIFCFLRLYRLEILNVETVDSSAKFTAAWFLNGESWDQCTVMGSNALKNYGSHGVSTIQLGWKLQTYKSLVTVTALYLRRRIFKCEIVCIDAGYWVVFRLGLIWV